MNGLSCPSCGGSRIRRDGSILAARGGRVQRYRCVECGKKFHPSLRLQPVQLREAFLDIEASQLTASFGHVISWALKHRGQDEVLYDCIRRRSLKEERRVLRSLLRALQDVDMVYTYYGSRFDIPFLRTRCLYHGLDFPEYLQLYHRDVYYIARGRLRLHGSRLAQVAEFLGIEGKTPLDPNVWVRASFGDKEALRYILEHNIADVEVLEKVYDRLEPYARPVYRSV